jgi:hypothetical protein
MTWTKEILDKTKQLGVLGYPLSKCLNILDLPSEQIAAYQNDFKHEGSDVQKAYQKGMDTADFTFDNMLFKKAQEGDLKALQMFDGRKLKYKLKK